MRAVQLHRNSSRLTRSLILVAFILLIAPAAYSQSNQVPKLPDPSADKSKGKDDDTRFGSPEAEMKSKLVIKEEKKRYDENLARAKEVSELAAQLSDGYLSHKSFSSEDGKKLERLEKLTKRIRNEAGGSDSETDPESKDISPRTEETVKHMAEVAEELNKLVEKTPRNVISAAVIDQANRLIVITQHLRGNR
jgi:hypothetical protein